MVEAENTSADGPALSPAQIEALQVNKESLAYFLARWSAAFDEYLVSKLEITPSCGQPRRIKMPSGVYILQIWRALVNVMLSLDLSSGETSWDLYTNEFKSIIDIAASFIDHTSKLIPDRSVDLRSTPQRMTNPAVRSAQTAIQPPPEHQMMPHLSRSASTQTEPFSDSTPDVPRATAGDLPLLAPKPAPMIKPTFSLSLGIIPPLYMIATRCRDPAIRRTAICLLSICNRREGIWDSWLSSRVTQRMLEIEEAGARQHLYSMARENGFDVLEPVEITTMQQIPEEVRVVPLGSAFGAGRQGTVRYRKSIVGREGIVGPDRICEEHFV